MSLRKKEPLNLVLSAAAYARSRASFVSCAFSANGEHPPAVRDGLLVVVELGTGVEDSYFVKFFIQPGHREAGLVGVGVSAGSDNYTNA